MYIVEQTQTQTDVTFSMEIVAFCARARFGDEAYVCDRDERIRRLAEAYETQTMADDPGQLSRILAERAFGIW
jgi:hypothetical protein